MPHEFNTPEGQARLSRALQADYDAAHERKKEQAEFEANQLQPWFDSLTIDQKDQLTDFIDGMNGMTSLGLERIACEYKHHHDVDEQDKLDL